MIYLSPPSITQRELDLTAEALQSGWVAPAGPMLSAFEEAFAKKLGAGGAVATASGTAALHIALLLAGVESGDTVVCSTLTFVASANPIRYLGAEPVFIDSERASWNLDPDLLEATLREQAAAGHLPKALVLVHVLGQAADIDRVAAICRDYGVTLIEDAAEALGATYKDRQPGIDGAFSIFSFNGNKMITTSGGGMFLAKDPEMRERARHLIAQAREPGADYVHRDLGFNYRMSNICAAIGAAQLERLPEKVQARRHLFERYERELSDLPLTFAPEAPWGTHSRWLTCLTLEGNDAHARRNRLLEAFAHAAIEARPVWRPMHQQPLYAGSACAGGQVAEDLWQRGLCLPSGDGMTEAEQTRVIETFRHAC